MSCELMNSTIAEMTKYFLFRLACFFFLFSVGDFSISMVLATSLSMK